MLTNLWRPATAAVLALALGGCVIAPLGPRHGGYGPVDRPVDGPVVGVEPPAPHHEHVPAAPGHAYVWIGGSWVWQLGRHVWIGGRWALPPSGHAWVPGRWHSQGQGWRWRGGYWGRR